jgi:lipoyl(octanoyl) transferase
MMSDSNSSILSQNSSPAAELEFLDWGLIDYELALRRMMALVDEVALGKHADGVLVFCTHPPIVTLGRATQSGDVFSWEGPVLEVSRGGRATYHGPSQLMVYPILNLKNPRKGRSPQEIPGFLRALEDGIIEALSLWGVSAIGRSVQKKEANASGADETGVWILSRKIASLGLGVKKWISYHGAAINLDKDGSAFQGLHPCGFRRETMISLEEVTNQRVDRIEFAERLKAILLQRL